MRRLYLLLLLMSLAGCVTNEEIMQSWMNKPKEQLFMEWGTPQKVSKLSDGGELLEYEEQYQDRVFDGLDVQPQQVCNGSTTTGSVAHNPYGGMIGGGGSYGFQANTRQNCFNYNTSSAKYRYETATCKKRFKTDKEGKLISWSYNGCS